MLQNSVERSYGGSQYDSVKQALQLGGPAQPHALRNQHCQQAHLVECSVGAQVGAVPAYLWRDRQYGAE